MAGLTNPAPAENRSKAMSDYQAIFDAVRSRISNGDVGAAIESSLRDSNLSHYVAMAADSFQQTCMSLQEQYERPSVLFKPEISLDGNAWIAILGDMPTGVVGVGSSPDEAMRDFDQAFKRKEQRDER